MANYFNTMVKAVEDSQYNQKMLAANISHELRSPLSRIQILFELLKESILIKNSVQKKYLKSVEIELKDLDKIFVPFFRMNSSFQKGFGLGLAITKNIIENHLGIIYASIINQKFIVQIEFPVKNYT